MSRRFTRPFVPWARLARAAIALAAGLALLAAQGCGPAGPACTAVGQTWTRPADGMEMVCVPAGEFLMGSAWDSAQVGDWERPQHTVYLDAYWIDRTEVTVAQFRVFVQATGHRTTAEEAGSAVAYVESSGRWEHVSGVDWQQPRGPEGAAAADDHPVVQVSWDDAVAYCAWAGGALPTEAQWEKAARGTDGRLYPWGNAAPTCDLANYEGCVGRPAAVGSYLGGASPYGALDMAGNVYEWVADWYKEGYYARSPGVNPAGPATWQYRVLRGGSWRYDAAGCRCGRRYWVSPRHRYDVVGFRCAMPARGRP